jgi:hypothetical protein
MALRASARSSGAPASSGFGANDAPWSRKYEPRLKRSYFACTVSTVLVSAPRTAFSRTTTSLGWLTAKYGSAVTINPNACSSVVTSTRALAR